MRLIRGLLHFTFACIPGCGQMSQGYMKRGLSQSILFWGAVALTVFLQMETLMILLLPLWMYCFFDSYNLRRCLREGYGPEDVYLFGLSDMDSRRLTELLNKRHSLIGWVLVLMGVYSLYQLTARRFFSFLRDLFPWMDWLYDLLVWDMPRILGTVLIVALGIWFIKGPKAPKEDGPSYTPPKGPAEPPKMKATPWTQAEAQFRQEAEPQAPEPPGTPEAQEPAPVVLEWKSAFNVEKFEREEAEKQEANHDGQ